MIKTYLKTKILYLIILLSYRFNRTKVFGENNVQGLDSFILVSWHGKVLGLMEHMKHKGYFALVSQSRDGDLIAGIAKNFGYSFFRGSSNKLFSFCRMPKACCVKFGIRSGLLAGTFLKLRWRKFSNV